MNFEDHKNQRLFKNTKDKSSSNVSVHDFHGYFASIENEILTVVNEEAETFCDTHEFDNVNCRYDELDKPMVVDEVIKAVKSLKGALSDLFISYLSAIFKYFNIKQYLILKKYEMIT